MSNVLPTTASNGDDTGETYTLRALIKTGVASALHWSGAHHLLARRPSVRHLPLVLGYHRVVENYAAAATRAIPPMLISLRTFERQLNWIGQRYDFVSLDQLAQWAHGERHFKRQVAAITFDDGYADLYYHAFPLLKRKGIPAAVFVVTERVGNSSLQSYDELYLLLIRVFARWPDAHRRLVKFLRAVAVPEYILSRLQRQGHNALQATWTLVESLRQSEMEHLLQELNSQVDIADLASDELRAMNWNMLREMANAGVTIGSHTRTHVRLTVESHTKMLDEALGSRQDIEKALGRPVEHFAYPGGAFNRAAVDAIRQAGYRCAFTSCPHRDPRYPALTIPRRLWWERSGLDAFGRLSSSVMGCQVSGVFDFAASCGASHGP